MTGVGGCQSPVVVTGSTSGSSGSTLMQNTCPEQWAADSESDHASRWLPLGSRNAADVVESTWSYGSAMRDTGRASLRASPPELPRTHPDRDGTTYHAGVWCVLSDSISSQSAFNGQQAHTVHSNTVRTVSAVVAVAASGSHESWSRYPRNYPYDAVAFLYVDACPAFSCRYQQTTYRYS